MLYQSAPLTGIASTLPFLPEWQRNGVLQHLPTFTKGMTSDSRRRPTKLTGYFLLDAGLVEKTEQPIMAFLTWLICDVFPI
jgi:hypothetical protein